MPCARMLAASSCIFAGSNVRRGLVDDSTSCVMGSDSEISQNTINSFVLHRNVVLSFGLSGECLQRGITDHLKGGQNLGCGGLNKFERLG
jgi:hypothetical protein